MALKIDKVEIDPKPLYQVTWTQGKVSQTTRFNTKENAIEEVGILVDSSTSVTIKKVTPITFKSDKKTVAK